MDFPAISYRILYASTGVWLSGRWMGAFPYWDRRGGYGDSLEGVGMIGLIHLDMARSCYLRIHQPSYIHPNPRLDISHHLILLLNAEPLPRQEAV